MALDWGYTEANGPHTWADHYELAGGVRQSPVNIESDSAVADPQLSRRPLTWTFPPRTIDVTNTGYCWKAHVRADESSLKGGPLSDTYRMVQFHCHWGADSSVGSEHQVDGRSYAAELHFVHMNAKYGTFEEALNHDDGLAVLGVFVDVGEEHAELKKLTDVLSQIKYKNQTAELRQDLDTARLLPDDRAYWTYLGSLTTPPCNECVVWIVFKEAITVSEQQLEAFRLMSCKGRDGHCSDSSSDSEEEPIVNNYRPPLPLGDRPVKQSFI